MFWTLSDPPVTIFNAIEALVELAEAANLPKSQAQIINYGLAIIRKTSDFEHALTEWYSRPPVEHTWQNFKSHFITAHRALKKVRGPTMQNTAFHQAHLMAEHVSDDIQQLKSEVLAESHLSPPSLQSRPTCRQCMCQLLLLPVALILNSSVSLLNFSNNFLPCRLFPPFNMVEDASHVTVIMSLSTVGAMGLVPTMARTARIRSKVIRMELPLTIRWEEAPHFATNVHLDGVGWNVLYLVNVILMIGF